MRYFFWDKERLISSRNRGDSKEAIHVLNVWHTWATNGIELRFPYGSPLKMPQIPLCSL